MPSPLTSLPILRESEFYPYRERAINPCLSTTNPYYLSTASPPGRISRERLETSSSAPLQKLAQPNRQLVLPTHSRSFSHLRSLDTSPLEPLDSPVTRKLRTPHFSRFASVTSGLSSRYLRIFRGIDAAIESRDSKEQYHKSFAPTAIAYRQYRNNISRSCLGSRWEVLPRGSIRRSWCNKLRPTFHRLSDIIEVDIPLEPIQVQRLQLNLCSAWLPKLSLLATDKINTRSECHLLRRYPTKLR